MKNTLKQTMSAYPVSVSSEESLIKAYFKMKQGKFRHLPVLDEEGNLTGIISDRDFQRAMWPMNTVDAHGLADGPAFKKDAIVSDYMSWPVKALPSDTNLSTTIKLMIDEKISAIAVTQNYEMVGIITHEDLLKILAETLNEPKSLREKVVTLAYNSPIGSVLDFLARIGI